MTIRVLVHAAHRLYRAALAELLQPVTQMEIVDWAEPPDGDVLTAAERHRPDVLVWDTDTQARTDGTDEFSVLGKLDARLPQCRVVLLMTSDRPALLRKAMGANPAGLLDKDAPPAHLIDTIRTVAAGNTEIHPNLSIAALYSHRSPFTTREADVLALAAEGCPASEIAGALGIRRGTARNYLSRCVTKAGARTRLEAIHIARKRGWI